MLKLTGFAAALATMAAAQEYTIEDFNTKMFWKRPEQGKYLLTSAAQRWEEWELTSL